jgi:phenylalanine ammonia-lyase
MTHLAKLLHVALDIRAMQAEFEDELHKIVQTELLANFGSYIPPAEAGPLFKQIFFVMLTTLDTTTTMDTADRMVKVAASSDSVIVKHFTGPGVIALSGLTRFNEDVAKRATASLTALREVYLTGARGPAPASVLLTRTRPVYEFVRTTLSIGMHGLENHQSFPDGLDLEDATIGENVSLIHEVRKQKLIVPNYLLTRGLHCRRSEMGNCRESL